MKKVLFFVFVNFLCISFKVQAQTILNEVYDTTKSQVRFTAQRSNTSTEIEVWAEVNFIKPNGEADMVRSLPKLLKKGDQKVDFAYSVPKGSIHFRIELLVSNDNRTAFVSKETRRMY